MHDKPKLSFFIFGISKVYGLWNIFKNSEFFWGTKDFGESAQRV
jgi:hypothetical protein